MAYEGRPSSDFVDMAIVRQHLTYATEYVSETAGSQFERGTDGCLRYMGRLLQFDSPLEVLFWGIIYMTPVHGDYDVVFAICSRRLRFSSMSSFMRLRVCSTVTP